MWLLQILVRRVIHLDLQRAMLEYHGGGDAATNGRDGIKRIGNACCAAVSGCSEVLFRLHGSGLAFREFFEAEAVYRVIIDHADRLHERIHNSAADELETAALKVFADGI